MAITKFQDLNLKNSFLFAAFMQDPENAKLILELLLNRDIGNVEVHTEHSILYNSDFKSVRLDVFLSEDSNVDFDLEMQDYVAKNLPKRSRYYQSQMDVSSLKPGEDYNSLRSLYVIFICTFDRHTHPQNSRERQQTETGQNMGGTLYDVRGMARKGKGRRSRRGP